MTAVAAKPKATKKAAAPQAPVAAETSVGTVAATLVELVRRIVDAFYACTDGPFSADANTLAELALVEANRIAGGDHRDGAVDASLSRMAALIKGAHALDLGEAPVATARHALLAQAGALAESAIISFGSVEHPCQALANGIKAGKIIGTAAKHAPAAEVAGDEEQRRSIAFKAYYSIQELAKGLKEYHASRADDDWPVYDCILGHIQQLSEVVYFAARLGGESNTYPSNETLQNFLDGHLGLILGRSA